MKLNRLLLINDTPVDCVGMDISLNIKNSSHATFTISSTKNFSGKVSLFLGYNDNIQHYFTGYIERSEQINTKETKIVVRDYIAFLERNISINMQHVSIKDVLAEISKKTSVAFNYDNNNDLILPHYSNNSTGKFILQDLCSLMGGDSLFLSQKDGVFIGKRENLNLMNNKAVILPIEKISKMNLLSFIIPLCPSMKLGLKIMLGNKEKVIKKIMSDLNSSTIYFDAI